MKNRLSFDPGGVFSLCNFFQKVSVITVFTCIILMSSSSFRGTDASGDSRIPARSFPADRGGATRYSDTDTGARAPSQFLQDERSMSQQNIQGHPRLKVDFNENRDGVSNHRLSAIRELWTSSKLKWNPQNAADIFSNFKSGRTGSRFSADEHIPGTLLRTLSDFYRWNAAAPQKLQQRFRRKAVEGKSKETPQVTTRTTQSNNDELKQLMRLTTESINDGLSTVKTSTTNRISSTLSTKKNLAEQTPTVLTTKSQSTTSSKKTTEQAPPKKHTAVQDVEPQITHKHTTVPNVQPQIPKKQTTVPAANPQVPTTKAPNTSASTVTMTTSKAGNGSSDVAEGCNGAQCYASRLPYHWTEDASWALGSIIFLMSVLTFLVLYTGLWKKRNTMGSPLENTPAPKPSQRVNIAAILKSKLGKIPGHLRSKRQMHRKRRNGRRYEELPLRRQNGFHDDDPEDFFDDEEEDLYFRDDHSV